MLFFFFQAEDGIRDLIVTGVQTCALPIYRRDVQEVRPRSRGRQRHLLPEIPPPWKGHEERDRRDPGDGSRAEERGRGADRKSTRLNSSHDQISYAVFCLKKKNTETNDEGA